MEKLKHKNYQVGLSALALSACALAGSEVQVEAKPVDTPQPTVSYELPPHGVETASRSEHRKPLPNIDKPATPQSEPKTEKKQARTADDNATPDDYWQGSPEYFRGLKYKQEHDNPHALDNAKILYAVAKQAGLSNTEVGCLENLAYRESGISATVSNESSGAYGIPQALPGDKMASAGKDWETNPATQIQWMIGYVNDRYGGACEAWDSWQDKGWY